MRLSFFNISLLFLVGCGVNNPYHHPDTPARFKIKSKLEMEGENNFNEAYHLMKSFIEKKGITYQSIELNEQAKTIELNLITDCAS